MTGQPRFVTVRELFDGTRQFRVPIYQRAYTWEKRDIEILIRDVASVLGRPSYYIGSLVLHEGRDVESDRSVFEVVDGQQRLTTLFITMTHPALRGRLSGLLKPFEITDQLLSFEERKRSNLDLGALARATPGGSVQLQEDGIRAGADAVMNLLGNEQRLARVLLDQGIPGHTQSEFLVDRVLSFLLDNVRIVLTELPRHTDLNHYFEVMNTRGEQLEKHEIVKARLLGLFGDDIKHRALFASIWDACSDVTRHVQARFNTADRSRLFGDPARNKDTGWSTFLPSNIEELVAAVQQPSNEPRQNVVDLDSVLEALDDSTSAVDSLFDDDDASRYGAIIDFPNFLLHVLRLHTSGGAGGTSGIALDDKRLVVQFERSVTTAQGALDFAFRLLRTKFLFDNFIIKPLDEPGDNDGSNWVIHSRHYTQSGTRNATLSSRNPFEQNENQQVLMAQAMFQVTHQGRIYKEFLYKLLKYLDGAWTRFQKIDGGAFIQQIHRMAEQDLDALDLRTGDGLDSGTGVPHFALNLLDYKLWFMQQSRQVAVDLPSVATSGFRFAYRTSIEHFLPTNFAESDEQRSVVNDFGNLCLMTRTENSRRSDHTPDWKVEKYGEVDQSLKLHYMCALQRIEKAWGPEQITRQGGLMRKVLFTPLPT
ncbi:DUF262 domain-containing protein [Arthrobacter crusticola]|uniref:DUF262 domain-containing protein n=1 Tax=Arthrobacter crusticola TaxID=2547960 RepID=A0A4V3AM75_9MICC|nr:DUF262 domain-containing protein [Arthrobacter crusticola]TDK25849.1 DUF262 domain-containing protein [Arthrobacter crusticola]